MSGQLNLAIIGLMLLTVITILLFLSRFADTEPRTLRFPPTLINWYPSWLITLKFSYVPLVPDRDISLNEYKVLKNPVWCGFYNMAVVIVITHAAEFDIIHPPDVVEKYALDAVIGALGDGGEGDDEEDDSSEGGCTMEEVAKYNKKDDVWVVLGLLVPASWRRVGNPYFYWGGQYNRVRHAPPS